MTNNLDSDKRSIRFIDSNYNDLFRIPDGGCIQIHYPDETVIKPCKFINEYHTQIGYSIYHICQFAELMEHNDASYMPEPKIMGDEAAWKVGNDIILAIQVCEEGYDYTLCDINYKEIDGGKWGDTDHSMIEVRTEILNSLDLGSRELKAMIYEDVMEQVFEVGKQAKVVTDPISEFAYRFDRFTKDFDPYKYKDHVEDRKVHIAQIQADIRNGELTPYRVFLEQAINDALEKVDVIRAKMLLKIMDRMIPEQDMRKTSLDERLKKLQEQVSAATPSCCQKDLER